MLFLYIAPGTVLHGGMSASVHPIIPPYSCYNLFFYSPVLHFLRAPILFSLFIAEWNPASGSLYFYTAESCCEYVLWFRILCIFLLRPMGSIRGLTQFHGSRGEYSIHFSICHSQAVLFIFCIPYIDIFTSYCAPHLRDFYSLHSWTP